MGRLSKEEQTELVKSAQSGDMYALKRIAEEFSGFIKYVSNNVFSSYEEMGVDLSDVSGEDVYQSGFSGLFSAVNKYDSGSNAAFSTYAYSCIAGEIREQIRFELSRLGITNTERMIAALVDFFFRDSYVWDEVDTYFDEGKIAGHIISEFDELLKKYGLRYELGFSWSLTAYKINYFSE